MNPRVLIGVLSLSMLGCGATASSAAPEQRGATDDEPTIAAPTLPRDRRRSRRLVQVVQRDVHGGFCRAVEDGSVWCWGPYWDYDHRPHRIEGVEGAVELVAVGRVVCARSDAGSVVCFRRGLRGPSLMQIAIEDAVDLDVLGGEVCAVRETGRVACWGGSWTSIHGGESWRTWSSDGVPSFGSEAWSTVTERDDVHDIATIRPSAPGDCWCGIRRGGGVTCWGRSGLPGHRSPDNEAVDVPGLVDVVDLAFGEEHTCVLRRDQGVLCTGGRYSNAEQPDLIVVRPREGVVQRAPEGWAPLLGTARVVELAWRIGEPTACGRLPEGELECWRPRERDSADELDGLRMEARDAEEMGDDDYARGVREEIAQRIAGVMPEELRGRVLDIAAIEAGGCASLVEGGVRCWGDVPAGVGRRDAVTTPRRVEGLRGVVSLAAANNQTCAVDGEHRLHCWGSGSGGAFHGVRPRGDRATPERVDGLDGAAEVLVGSSSVCIRRTSGEVRCRGRIAQPGGARQRGPVRSMPYLRGVSSPVLNTQSICGIRDGRIRCQWSRTDYEGDESRIENGTVEVPNVRDAAHLAGARSRFIVMTRDGRFGTFTLSESTRSPDVAWPEVDWLEGRYPGSTPAMIERRICAMQGSTLSCASRGDDRLQAESALDLGPLRGLAGSYRHTCAVRADGRVVCWGHNGFGELGREPLGGPFMPTVVEGITDARIVVGGEEYSCAANAAGEVYCWGRAERGQLGISPIHPPLPRPVTVPGVN